MKKLLAILLSLCLLVTATACATPATTTPDTSPTSTDDTSQPASSTNSELPHFTLYFAYTSFADKLGAQFKDTLEQLGAEFNVDFVFVEVSSTEDSIAAIETNVASGELDGIFGGATPAFLKAANGLPCMQYAAAIKEDIKDEVATYDNLIGSCAAAEYDAGYEAARGLYDAGSRKVGLVGVTKGLYQQHDDRAEGFLAFVAEHDDFELLSDNYSAGQFTEAIGSFAAAFPEMDGIFCTAGADSLFHAMETEGLIGSVKLATIDVPESAGEYFQNGTLVWSSGGQYINIELGFAVLYSYLIDGTRLTADSLDPILTKQIYLSSYEDYLNYVKYVDSGVPYYTAEEVKAMIPYFNAAADESNLRELALNLSLEDVMERHADLV